MHIKEHNLALWTEKLLIIQLTHRDTGLNTQYHIVETEGEHQ